MVISYPMVHNKDYLILNSTTFNVTFSLKNTLQIHVFSDGLDITALCWRTKQTAVVVTVTLFSLGRWFPNSRVLWPP